ncbi:hypothetical protein PVL29_020086 [Vitis rotundifolia]|uniref:Uncharacterized protein n=1 Tax=Vitis rotundifolia TaxID=103349 RepID=A0AA38Z2H4_VITRO|nr:hypothetical protein PVL29_020086 [Vitis rotundifolia]
MGSSTEEGQCSHGSTGEEEEVQEAEHYCNAMQLVTSSLLPMVMQTAIELGLFHIIAKAGQASASEIASQLPANNPAAPIMLGRILYFLTSHSVLTCSALDADDGRLKRVYGLTPVSKYFVPDQDGISLSPLLTLAQDKVFMDSWSVCSIFFVLSILSLGSQLTPDISQYFFRCHMKNSIIEGGIPFNRAHGVNAYEYSAKNPIFNQVFNRAMLNHTIMITNKLVESYKGFGHLKQVVDVGGGLGTTLGIITSKYPSIKAINFDLPHVIQDALPYPGVEHLGGDMFESVPNGEAIFMKWILHNWSDDQCLKLLKNCYKALPEHGMAIVVEGFLPEIPERSASVQSLCKLDLIMMTQIPGGRERTRQEFLDLAMAAGFAGIRFECPVYNYWIMEFFK